MRWRSRWRLPCSKLNRKMADTARTRQHQNPLTGLQATHIEQRLPQ